MRRCGAARSEQEKQESDLSDNPAKLEKSIRNYTRELSYSAYVRKDHLRDPSAPRPNVDEDGVLKS